MRTCVEWFERALHDHAALATPAGELEFDFGELPESFVGFALPVVPVDGGDGFFDVGGELEFEEEGWTLAVALFVSGHDGFLTEADVATVEADTVWQGVVCGKLGDHATALQKVISRHQSAIRRKRLVTAA